MQREAVIQEGVVCDGADRNLLSQSHPQLVLSLDLGVGETLGQLSQLVLSGRRRRRKRRRLPAVPKPQHTGRKVMILRPLQPADTGHMTQVTRAKRLVSPV